MLTQLLDVLSGALANIPTFNDATETARQKAAVIVKFACTVSEAIARQVGHDPAVNQAPWFVLADTDWIATGSGCPPIRNLVARLGLLRIDPNETRQIFDHQNPKLGSSSVYDVGRAVRLEFAPNKVMVNPYQLEDEPDDRVHYHHQWSYEEAARQVAIHLTQQILEIMKELPAENAGDLMGIYAQLEAIAFRLATPVVEASTPGDRMDLLDTTIRGNGGLSRRAQDLLIHAGIMSVGVLVTQTDEDLFAISHFGVKDLRSVYRYLGKIDRRLAPSQSDGDPLEIPIGKTWISGIGRIPGSAGRTMRWIFEFTEAEILTLRGVGSASIEDINHWADSHGLPHLKGSRP